MSMADLTSHFSPVWMSKERQVLHKEGGPRSASSQWSAAILIAKSISRNRRWQYTRKTRYWGQQYKKDRAVEMLTDATRKRTSGYLLSKTV